MSEHFRSNPEIEKAVADDARKFVVTSGDPRIYASSEVVSFRLSVHWLEASENNETKLVYKESETGEIQVLLIAKKTIEGKRTADKRSITGGEYKDLLPRSIIDIEKERHEFRVEQNDAVFDMKFDAFAGSGLRILEVDGPNRDDFDPHLLMGDNLTEVSSDKSYEGYRVAAKM